MDPFFIVLPAIVGASIASGLFVFGLFAFLPRIEGKPAPREVPQDDALPHDAREPELKAILAARFKGALSDQDAIRQKYSRDTSVFMRMPELVAMPEDATDVSALVKGVRDARAKGIPATLTARSAGTDMSGGPLTTSIVVSFTEHMNRVLEVGDGYAVTEPGAYYRDFEKRTLAKDRQILPSYPASRELAAMGGLVNNDSGGERTLEYGKTRDYVESIDLVLSDGGLATLGVLTQGELQGKLKLQTFEGDIYRGMHALLMKNRDAIKAAKPKVSKNSAGYALWDVMDEKTGTFDLAKLVTGAQGTLALMTRARLRLVREQDNRAMLVIFLDDLNVLPEIVRKILPFNPESFESYDDHTFSLAVKLLPQLLARMGLIRAARLGLSFIPEALMALRGGIPKLILMAEFSEDTVEEAQAMALRAQAALASLNLPTRLARDERAAEKYWVVRREAFSLLRQKLPGLTAAPFIDDFVVPPDSYPDFLPKLFAMLDAEGFVYAVTGHIGNGNFHIFPLLDLSEPENRQLILDLSPKVYALVIAHGGTTTGEHNDGIIRTPYLPQLFGPEMVTLFEETKRIWDPEGIFNPGKKVSGTFADIERDMIQGI